MLFDSVQKKFQAIRQRERRCSQDLLLGEGVQYAEPLFLFWLSSGVVLGLEPNTGSRADYTRVREFIPFGIEIPDQGFNIYNSLVQEGKGFRAKRGESAGWKSGLKTPLFQHSPSDSAVPQWQTRDMHDATWASEQTSER